MPKCRVEDELSETKHFKAWRILTLAGGMPWHTLCEAKVMRPPELTTFIAPCL